jgi:hypothetical protein
VRAFALIEPAALAAEPFEILLIFMKRTPRGEPTRDSQKKAGVALQFHPSGKGARPLTVAALGAARLIAWPPQDMSLQFLCPTLRMLTPRAQHSILLFSGIDPRTRPVECSEY